MKFDAVVFDLDGTLLDTLADIANSGNEVLASYGIPPYEVSAYRTFVGDGVVMLFTRALPEAFRTKERIAECAARFSEVYGRRWKEHSQPYEGIVELLSTLASRGVQLTVLSNKPHAFTVKYAAEFFPETDFAMVLGQRAGIPHKPDPTGANEIIASLHIPADKILYLGDSGVDMQTAVVAKMFPVGAAWGFRSREELLKAGAQVVIEAPLEMLRFFE